VTVREFAPNPTRPHETWPWLFVGATPVAELYGDGGVEFTTDVRVAFADALAAFAQRALSCAPPGPVSDERLLDLRKADATTVISSGDPAAVADLLSHIDHQAAVIRRQQAMIDDMALDGLKAVADAARVRGMEEMRQLWTDWWDGYPSTEMKRLYGIEASVYSAAELAEKLIAGEIARREEAPR
jgi:hypothetical protein